MAEKAKTKIEDTNAGFSQDKTEQQKKTFVAKDVDVNQLIPVRNGFQGKLVYVSSRTGEKFLWTEFGGEQEIELKELRNAKNSAKSFFTKNWFMFDEDYDWVIDYLGLRRYYQNAISIDNFDDIFTKSPAEIKSIVSKLSSGQKKSVGYRARQLIAEDGIDSLKVIETLEKSLGVELIER